jgi:putative transposase
MLPMPARLLRRLSTLAHAAVQRVRHRLLAATRPATASVAAGALADLARGKPELVAENALLRHRLAILRRNVRRPRSTAADRALLVLLASHVRAWRSALLIVQPDMLLRWHRQLFRRYWRGKSRAALPAHRPPLAPATVALIREMAAANRLWGAERISSELLKLNIRVAKSTIQRYLREAHPPHLPGQSWSTFIKNHAAEIWACAFLPVTGLLFRPVYTFFVIALDTLRVVHVGVTRHPTDAWVAQQLREATPFGQCPRYLIRDNDRKYGSAFAQVAAASGIKVLRTPYRAPWPTRRASDSWAACAASMRATSTMTGHTKVWGNRSPTRLTR